MRLTLLGTGAADGIPSFAYRSPLSDLALHEGGKNRRTRSAALVDDDLKIDLGPDTWGQCAACGVDPKEWTGLVFTHSHDDHLCPSELQYFLIPFTEDDRLPFTVYGNAEVLRIIRERYLDWPIELLETKSFQPFCHAETRITPIHANHKLDEDSQNLIIQRGGRTLLYATDTGIWLEDTWNYLASQKLDGLVIECTEGFHATDYWGHLSIPDCVAVVTRLRDEGILRADAPVVTTHHSAQGNATHSQLEDELGAHGIQPGYDGMVLEI